MSMIPSQEELKKEAENFLKKHCPNLHTPQSRRRKIWFLLKDFIEENKRTPTSAEIAEQLNIERSAIIRDDLVTMKNRGNVVRVAHGVYVPVGDPP